jgi:TrmH family RNA methyltransferase
LITSTANQKIKNISALLKKSKERRNQKAFVVEGSKMCFEAPLAQVQEIYVSESFLAQETQRRQLEEYLSGGSQCSGDPQLAAGAQRSGNSQHPGGVQFASGAQVSVPVEIVSDSVFSAMSDTRTPQGILSVIRMPEYSVEQMLDSEHTLLLILENIQDPGNLGTMLRTGEGAGITGVIVSGDTVDLYNPKTVRSTMGSIYRIPYLVAQDWEGTLRAVKDKGVTLYAAHLQGSVVYDEPDYTKASAFLIGNEGNGLTDATAALADARVRIPMAGQVESLNAAVSASLLTYECSRQRRNSR